MVGGGPGSSARESGGAGVSLGTRDLVGGGGGGWVGGGVGGVHRCLTATRDFPPGAGQYFGGGPVDVARTDGLGMLCGKVRRS